MRQRIKVAAALVHDPEILLLDELFNGMVPRQRIHMMELLASLARKPARSCSLAHPRGGGAAVGHHPGDGGRRSPPRATPAIRRLMTSRPHVFNVRSSDDRRLAALLVGRP